MHAQPEQFYDVVDSTGEVVETAEQQQAEVVPLERERKPPTPGELRKLRKQYVTVQHPRVVACQHRLDLERLPRHTNCESCWFAWFNNHGEVIQQFDEMHTSQNDQLIIQLVGKKAHKRWLQFMATVASWKQQEIDEQAG